MGKRRRPPVASEPREPAQCHVSDRPTTMALGIVDEHGLGGCGRTCARAFLSRRPQWTPQIRPVVDGSNPASWGGVQDRLVSSLIGCSFASLRRGLASCEART